MKTAGTISISIVIRSTVVAVLGLILMFLTSPELTGLTIAILPVLLLALRFYSTLNKKYTREGLTSSAEASTIAEEVFGSIRTVSASYSCYLSLKLTQGLADGGHQLSVSEAGKLPCSASSQLQLLSHAWFISSLHENLHGISAVRYAASGELKACWVTCHSVGQHELC